MVAVSYVDLNNPRIIEVSDAFHFRMWMHVLACPRMYGEMKRRPPREHVLHLHARYLPYALSKREDVELRGYFVSGGDERRRHELANRIGVLLQTWNPCGLPAELTEVARALLEAEGQVPPEGGWDSLTFDSSDSLEDSLMWPEGVPALSSRNQGEPSDESNAVKGAF